MRSEAWKDKLGRVTDEMTTEPASAHESGHKTLRSLSQQVLTTHHATGSCLCLVESGSSQQN